MTMLVNPPDTDQSDATHESPEMRSLVASWYAGTVNRREFVARATAALGSLAAATTLLAACTGGAPGLATATVPGNAGQMPTASAPPMPTPTFPPSQLGTRVPPTQRMAMFPSGGAMMMGYLCPPENRATTAPAIIVIHENMGLTEHIQDVTRRAARENFWGFGIDYLSREGGTMAFNTPQEVTAGINRLSDDQIIADTTAAVQFLKANGATKVGAVGFCWGGRRSLLVALRSTGIDAAVSYYGGGLPATSATQTVNVLDELRNVKVPIMGNYGSNDPVVPQQVVETMQDNLSASGQPYNVKQFDNTGHAFNNDTRPAMGNMGYNQAASAEAWGRTLAWFRTYLA